MHEIPLLAHYSPLVKSTHQDSCLACVLAFKTLKGFAGERRSQTIGTLLRNQSGFKPSFLLGILETKAHRLRKANSDCRECREYPEDLWVFIGGRLKAEVDSGELRKLQHPTVMKSPTGRRLCHQLTPFHKINTGPPFPRLYNVFVLYIYAYIYTTRYSSSHQEACFIQPVAPEPE